MYIPYNEICNKCKFQGEISKPIKIGNLQDLRFIECRRDNGDAKEEFKRTGKEEDLQLWSNREGNFLHCLYYYKTINDFK